MKISEESNYEVKAAKDHSQILIKITPSSRTFEDATNIINGLGVLIIETRNLSPNNWILLKLDVKDMRDVALKLTEHGFTVKGINALP